MVEKLLDEYFTVLRAAREGGGGGAPLSGAWMLGEREALRLS